MAPVQKPDLVFRPNGRVHLNRRGCQFNRLLAVEEWGSEDSECIIFSKYVDHSLKMLLQGRKKRVKRSGEREIVYNVYKFINLNLKWVSQSLFQKCRRESLKQHVLAGELYVGYWKKVNMWKLVSQWHFQLRTKHRPKVCTKGALENLDEAVLRWIVHNFYLTEKQRPTLMCESAGYGGGGILTETGTEKNGI